MKKRSIIFPLFILVMNSNAQDSTVIFKAVSEQQKKNELSINIAPLFKILLAGEGSNRFSFTYKRNLNEKSALRVLVVADIINNPYNSGRKNRVVLNTDSVLVKRTTEFDNYVIPHLNFGYERIFGKRKLKWFYGADITIGYFKTHVHEKETTLQRDTVNSSASWIDNAFDFNSKTISQTDSKIFSLGMYTFFGAKYSISKRFSISAQIGGDLCYRSAAVSETGTNGKRNYNESSFDFDQSTGVLNDISIIYKF